MPRLSSVFIIKEVHARSEDKSGLYVCRSRRSNRFTLDENQRFGRGAISRLERSGRRDYGQEDLYNFTPGVLSCRLSEARDAPISSSRQRDWRNTWSKEVGERNRKERNEKSGPMNTQTRGGADRFSLSFPEITGVCVAYGREGAIVLRRIIERGNLVNRRVSVFLSGCSVYCFLSFFFFSESF